MRPRLLIVDDDDANRLTFTALLEDAGFDVAEARSLAEGGALLSCEAPDVVVLDRSLGDGSGLHLIPLVRSSRPSARIVVLSGTVDQQESGADLELTKGSDPGSLVDAILALVSRRS